MAYLRQPTSPAGDDWISVLVDGLPYIATSYTTLRIYCYNSSFVVIGSWDARSGGGSGQTTGTYRSGTATFNGLTPGTTYYFSAELVYSGSTERVPSSGYYSAMTTGTASTPRPSNFSWTYTKSSGSSFNLYAFEWNNFFARINEFRTYKNLSTYSFTTAVSSYDFYAYMYNQAITAISAMSPSVSLPPTRNSGNIIYAANINQLVSSLNSIT